MRAFVAIALPEAVNEALESLTARLQRSEAKASWVKSGNTHLTLRFLGEVSESDVNRFGERLALAYQDMVPFGVTVCGVGVFPSLKHPSVVWAGVEPIEGPLSQAREIAEQAAVAIGLAPETKRFHPHLTVARIRDAGRLGSLRECIEAEQAFSGGAFEVARVSLFSSQLTPRGPVYRKIREFRL